MALHRRDLKVSLATLRRRRITKFLRRRSPLRLDDYQVSERLGEIQEEFSKKIGKAASVALVSVLLLRGLEASGQTTIAVFGYKFDFPSSFVSVYGTLAVCFALIYSMTYLQVLAVRNDWGNRISRRPHFDSNMISFFQGHDDVMPIMAAENNALIMQNSTLYKVSFSALGFLFLPILLVILAVFGSLFLTNFGLIFESESNILDRLLAFSGLSAQFSILILAISIHMPRRIIRIRTRFVGVSFPDYFPELTLAPSIGSMVGRTRR